MWGDGVNGDSQGGREMGGFLLIMTWALEIPLELIFE